MGPLRSALEVRAGGWIDVPARGTGRVLSVSRQVGTVTILITLEGGWAFTVLVGERIRYWDT
jgi:hypothetical protein